MNNNERDENVRGMFVRMFVSHTHTVTTLFTHTP